MKIKNIFSVLCFLFIGMACSMDEELINETTKTDPSVTEKAEVNIKLNVNQTQTKGGVSNPDGTASSENDINNVVVALVDAKGNILEIQSTNGTTEEVETDQGKQNVLKDIRFLTKVRENIKAIAIVNSKRDYTSCKTLYDLYLQTENNPENNPLDFVKVGEVLDIFRGYTGSVSTTNLTPHLVEIPVRQLMARIDFMGFMYTKQPDNANFKVEFVKAEILNANYKSYVCTGEGTLAAGEVNPGDYKSGQTPYNQTSSGSLVSGSNWYVVGNNPDDSSIGTPLMTNYSYTNTNANSPVSIRIQFKIDDELCTKEYVINPPRGYTKDGVNYQFANNTGIEYVQAGYLYRFYVKLTVTKNWIESSIACYTEDWIPENIEIEL
ncbi:hypothetical protein [Parabacteroides pacaensis]|uniref:hypothetical protein n=1 Tax=Parabacteroides pacaensis TaxID=2086575 RepID=UPI000D0FD3B7|nr:hypothetical protein [Parabacteroides pacaensis]